MKLAKTKRAFGKKRDLRIATDADGYQWIGDRSAYYVMDKSLQLTPQNVLTILDYDEDEQARIDVSEIDVSGSPWFDTCPVEALDRPLRPVVSVSVAGELVTVMLTEEGDAAMVRQSQIAPADGREACGFYLRACVDQVTGEFRAPVVAVFRGLTCSALIAPLQRRTAEGVWRMMRDASAQELRYCVEGTDEEEEDG